MLSSTVVFIFPGALNVSGSFSYSGYFLAFHATWHHLMYREVFTVQSNFEYDSFGWPNFYSDRNGITSALPNNLYVFNIFFKECTFYNSFGINYYDFFKASRLRNREVSLRVSQTICLRDVGFEVMSASPHAAPFSVLTMFAFNRKTEQRVIIVRFV